MTTADRNLNFIKTLSDQRFKRCVDLSANNEEAITLYTLNTKLSASFYVALQGLEVTLRNAINNCLEETYGGFWFDQPNLLRLGHQLEDVGEAKSRILHQKKNETNPILHDRVIAGLTFGFWVSMLGQEYEDLWRSDIYKISLTGLKGINRKTFSGPLKNIRDIRNRIAHHECILKYDLNHHYSQILYLVSVLSKESEYWIKQNSTFVGVYKENETILNKVRGVA